MKKLLVLFMTAACALCLALGISACGGGNGGGSKDHVHDYGELVPEQPATCTQEGFAAHYFCEGCQTYFDDQKREKQFNELTIPAKGHNYGELIPEQPATCTDEGLETHYHCEDCGKYFNSSQVETDYEDLKTDIDPNAHNWQISPTESNKKVCSACGAKENIYNKSPDETKIYFGEYPQSEVEESGLKATLGWEAGNGALPTADDANGWTDYNYYIGGKVQSYMWYIDVEYENARYRGVYFTSYRPAMTVLGGSSYVNYQYDNGYETNTVYWFKYEPIEWRILTQTDGTALLMSNIILDSQQYYHETSGTRTIDGDTVYPNNYKESDIRAWLNDTFYNTAFDEIAKSIIQQTEVDNSASTTYSPSNQYACGNTYDNIFLLSYKDLINTEYGFADNDGIHDAARLLQSTAYAKSQGAYKYENNASGYWWLRSPSTKNPNVYNIYIDGTLGSRASSNSCGYTGDGVVPALRIKL